MNISSTVFCVVATLTLFGSGASLASDLSYYFRHAVPGVSATSPEEDSISCRLPWGGSIDDGEEITAWQEPSAMVVELCVQEVRVCSGGDLSGSFTNATCVPWEEGVPDPFTIADAEAGVGETIYSDKIVPTGFGDYSLLKVDGDGKPRISVNDGSWSTIAQIMPGDTIQLRMTPTEYDEVHTARILSYSGFDFESEWKVTTPKEMTVAWGYDLYDQASIPVAYQGEEFRQVSAGGNHTVAIRQDGTVVSWGRNHRNQGVVPPAYQGVPFKTVEAGVQHNLGILADGTLVAWGYDSHGQATVPSEYSGMRFKAVAAGSDHSLAVTESGQLVAWGNTANGRSTVPPEYENDSFIAVSAGNGHSVALRDDGSVVAWGVDTHFQARPPSGLQGRTRKIASYAQANVAITTDGEFFSWGNRQFPMNPPEGYRFKDISLGLKHVLGLTTDGILVAWGYSGYSNENTVPAKYQTMRFKSISAGASHNLAIPME